MDGRGRIAQSLNWIARLCAQPPTGAALRARPLYVPDPAHASDVQRLLQRCWIRLMRVRLPRGAGISAAIALILGGLGYGVMKGGHVPEIVAFLEDTRDQAANAVGFSIADLTVTGHNQLTKEEVLAAARVTGRSSLLFLDVDATRERLKTNSWIADATVRKLLPGQLQIEIKEREPFALWQKDRRVSVIADDGTVLEGFVAPQLLTLPLVVGRGAESRAKDFLVLLGRFPAIRDQVRASILVGERRWNLRLRNGLDVRLPETEVAGALEQLVMLDREVKLLTRDITAVDMRLPDRVTVRLSEKAGQARQEQLKELIKKGKKGGRA
ncbi:MAG: FtsQ-type POTRA domain-containing protein [Rhizobiales bacterium]|nr:FtsQ-type POTRA domain-containing protein [Hyphomicrobiales bacterium]